MNPDDPFAATIPRPTARRPLLGLTVLVVEDSRYACEAIRLLCLRSGARIRRADSLRSARRHLRVYRPTVVIVDLGLPDGDGLDLIAELAQSQPPVEAVLAMSGESQLEQAALAAGAKAFIAKPILSIAAFQECLLSHLPAERRPAGPRVITDELIEPDLLAYQDDIAHIADVLEGPTDDRTLEYVAQFLSGVARSAADGGLEEAALALRQRRGKGHTAASEMARVAGLIQDRLAQRMAI